MEPPYYARFTAIVVLFSERSFLNHHDVIAFRHPIPKQIDQSVLFLWRKAVSPKAHVEEGRQASRGDKEPRFLFLDIRGVIGGENAVLPVLKYWVR